MVAVMVEVEDIRMVRLMQRVVEEQVDILATAATVEVGFILLEMQVPAVAVEAVAVELAMVQEAEAV
jgi:uncharacterized membrane protein